MDLNNKKQRKILSRMKKDIKYLNFKINHKSLEKIKNEITRRGKIVFCKGRLFAPYVIALSLSIGSFSIFGATPFIIDKKKNYQKVMKEIDSDNHTRVITQYDDFENNDNIITLYEKWEKKSDNKYSRNIKLYKLGDLSEDRIINILNKDINSIEEIFGNPISEKVETRDYLDDAELEKKAFLSARIYSENKDDFYYINQPIEKNISETILWFIVFIVFESLALVYRIFSPFNYDKTIKKINNMYSVNSSDMLEKRLRILETNYRIMSQYNDFIDNSIISKLLDSNKNTKLSKLSSDELKNVLIIAMESELVLRDKLTYNNIFTYGTEIELERVKIKSIYKSMEKFKSSNWTLTRDLSLKKGIEIISPIMCDTKSFWQELNDICNKTNNYALIDKNCGLHVHVGAHVLGRNDKAWLNFIKLYSTYENIIFRFAYGEFYNYRDNILEYAKPISKELWNNYLYLKKINADLKDILFSIKQGKYNAVNFDNIKYETIDQIVEGNTVEIRCGNGCKNPIIIQNYVNFLLSLFRYAKSDNFNDELVDKRHEICRDIYDNIDMYNEVYLEQAIELIDEIFDNNLDKIYFLNQYLKDFKADKKKFDKNKTFTKK